MIVSGQTSENADIQRLDYLPVAPYRLDLEIFSVSNLRRRERKEKVRATYRYAFHMLLCVTHGTCTQMVDFKPVPCEPGALLTVRPGQAHSFGHDEDWDGWMILFRPELLLATSAPASDLKVAVDLERLPEHLRLGDHELRSVTEAIARMREDAMIDAPPEKMNALLRYQLYALLSRLSIFHGRQEAHDALSSRALQRFKRFQQLVDQCYSKWQQVADYAEQLGCTEKSLTRATTLAVEMSAKAFIASRINLEAKRLLVHTNLPINLVAQKLGFDEATNFSKFFKRETGCTPAEFRRRQMAE
jgi:AraC-like DNA-binding protein